ncbi:MAG: flagellar biosynthetic protein FliO [Thermodesulfobacteriota bacterium]|nr:flagellar biosynthetic protein FliO [Thermodesulfobacteriota bacterium]
MIESTDPSLLSNWLRMLWGLFIVLGILLILYGIMRKRLSFVQSNSKSKIKVREIRHLMPKKSLCLVEVGGQEFLLGLGVDTITLLSTIEKSKNDTFNTTLASATKQHEQQSS